MRAEAEGTCSASTERSISRHWPGAGHGAPVPEMFPFVNGSSFWKSSHRRELSGKQITPHRACDSPGQRASLPGAGRQQPWEVPGRGTELWPTLRIEFISSPLHSLSGYSASSSTYFIFFSPGLERVSIPAVQGISPERLKDPQTN